MNHALPEPAVIALIGVNGSGQSALARTWPASYRLELDAYRERVSGYFSVKSNVLSQRPAGDSCARCAEPGLHERLTGASARAVA
ncbi:hypothetical protein [Streptomyces sp. NPDC086766]|uniref:hypothetical protein n=1 Tax=Streptomyces sp. NPDC086766 TaxID=3365754 RepID=UPI0038136FA0